MQQTIYPTSRGNISGFTIYVNEEIDIFPITPYIQHWYSHLSLTLEAVANAEGQVRLAFFNKHT